jgi:4-diphosphocytidyl-2-C-methyl-D-erythritol kinase
VQAGRKPKAFYNEGCMPTTVRSHAKINLGLGIGAPRADGFHGLVTVYQTLEMHDLVTITARPASSTSITLTTNHPGVPTDERNTAWKMVSLALEEIGATASVTLHIEKRLPVQGGLGAGSANAIAALIGLENETAPPEPEADESLPRVSAPWAPVERAQGTRVKSTTPERKVHRELRGLPMLIAERDWAERVGSDVPLFLVGGTVLGLDRGQQVFPLPDLDPIWCVIAVPEIGVSTPQAFRDWDALCAREGLTAEASTDKLRKLSRAYLSAFGVEAPADGQTAGSSGVIPLGNDLAGPTGSALVRTGITSWIENDFERVVFPQHPSLREIKRILAGSGTPEAALYASLSGSGSALYGLYRTCGDAEAAQSRLGAQAGELKLRSVVITRTLPRTPYWQEMLS